MHQRVIKNVQWILQSSIMLGTSFNSSNFLLKLLPSPFPLKGWGLLERPGGGGLGSRPISMSRANVVRI